MSITNKKVLGLKNNNKESKAITLHDKWIIFGNSQIRISR